MYYRKTIIIRTGLTGNGNDPIESPRATNIVISSIDRGFVCFVGRQNKTLKQSSSVVVVVVQSYWFTTIP